MSFWHHHSHCVALIFSSNFFEVEWGLKDMDASIWAQNLSILMSFLCLLDLYWSHATSLPQTFLKLVFIEVAPIPFTLILYYLCNWCLIKYIINNNQNWQKQDGYKCSKPKVLLMAAERRWVNSRKIFKVIVLSVFVGDLVNLLSWLSKNCLIGLLL